MATLNDITSNTWGISTLGPGAIAQGLGSLRQCIDLILRTSLGTDPLRPFFGSEIYKYQDAPTSVTIPNIKRSILQALAMWESRITVTEVKHYHRELGHLEFEIVYSVNDSDLRDSIIFDLYNGTFSTGSSNLILQALFPPAIDTKRNNINFILNNERVQPYAPATGFTNISETYAWVVANWGSYGRWFLLADRIQLYLKPGSYQQASLSIAVSSTYRFATDIPLKPADVNGYAFSFAVDGLDTFSQNGFKTKERLLIYVRATYGHLGNWQIENSSIVQPGEFNNDFNSDFTIDAIGYQLVLYSDTVTKANIQVS